MNLPGRRRVRFGSGLGRALAALAICGALTASPAAEAARPSRRIVGYWPDWTRSPQTFPWDGLTDLVWFSAGLSTAGALTPSASWRSAGPAAIDAAHKQGVRVSLSVACFVPDSLHAALTPGEKQDALIAALVDEALVRVPGDGVDLDFEQLRAADRAGLVSFVVKLRAALRARRADAEVSLAMPAVDWSSAYDAAALADAADALFIMGYDYHWATSDPGPTSPLTGGARWSKYHVTSTVETYLTKIGAARARKLVLGLPLFGFDYPTAGPDLGAKATGDGKSVRYAAARTDAAKHGRRWDTDSQTPYYTYQASGAWHQVFYDDDESLGKKLDLAIAKDLGGIGWWALGFEDDTLWKMVKARLVPPDPMPPVDADMAGPPPADLGAPEPAADAGEAMADAAGGCQIAAAGAGRPGAGAGADRGWAGALFFGGVAAMALARARRRADALGGDARAW